MDREQEQMLAPEKVQRKLLQVGEGAGAQPRSNFLID
jgi:hypothetical protein